MDYTKKINVYPDFPKKGISFKDITPLLADEEAFESCINDFASILEAKNIDAIVAAESRGFIFGAALAYKLHIPFIMARKGGKLPGDKITVSYNLEYGHETLEMPKGSIKAGAKVAIVDDLIATGGTFIAMKELVEKIGAEPTQALAVIELIELDGREKIGLPLESLVKLSANC